MFTKSKSVVNFGPGPAKLPEVVLDRIQREIHEYENTGVSILEISHRAPEFDNLLHKAEQNLRELAGIPHGYHTLFLQGGGTGQFAAVPLNLGRGQHASADYLVTGDWSKKAATEASKYLQVHKTFDLKKYTSIPEQSQWTLNKDSSYVYYCSNETIHGVEYNFVPETQPGIPLVADISSNALSRPIDVSKHGVIFAGTQKNLGTAGMAMVIVRDDLIGHANKTCPSIFDYKEQSKMKSVYNTPPVFCIYVTNLVLEWLKDLGGLEEMAKINERKAHLIYDVIDQSKHFYYCPVEQHCRSRMNIPFRIGSETGVDKLEKAFVTAAENEGLISLKGHRSVGGIRASLFNAVTLPETEKLADFMKAFYEKNGNQDA